MLRAKSAQSLVRDLIVNRDNNADELVPQGEPGTASVGKETKPALGCKRILHQAHAAAKAARTGWIC